MTLDGLTLRGSRRSCNPSWEQNRKNPPAGARGAAPSFAYPKRQETASPFGSGGDSRLHLTEHPKANPLQAPNFCMLLRKYIGGGRILSIAQPDWSASSASPSRPRTKWGCCRFLLWSLKLWKYSNIMLLNGSDVILDSIRHVSFDMSRVRQVLPAWPMSRRKWKAQPLSASAKSIADVLGREIFGLPAPLHRGHLLSNGSGNPCPALSWRCALAF